MTPTRKRKPTRQDREAESVALLQAQGLTIRQATDLASFHDLDAIKQQIEWLPKRCKVRNAAAFLVRAIQTSMEAPEGDENATTISPTWRRHNYAEELFRANQPPSSETKAYFKKAQALHDAVFEKIERGDRTPIEIEAFVADATSEALRRWPNLRADSASVPQAVDRVLAGRLHVSSELPRRLNLRDAQFIEHERGDATEQIERVRSIVDVAPPPVDAEANEPPQAGDDVELMAYGYGEEEVPF